MWEAVRRDIIVCSPSLQLCQGSGRKLLISTSCPREEASVWEWDWGSDLGDPIARSVGYQDQMHLALALRREMTATPEVKSVKIGNKH